MFCNNLWFPIVPTSDCDTVGKDALSRAAGCLKTWPSQDLVVGAISCPNEGQYQLSAIDVDGMVGEGLPSDIRDELLGPHGVGTQTVVGVITQIQGFPVCAQCSFIIC